MRSQSRPWRGQEPTCALQIVVALDPVKREFGGVEALTQLGEQRREPPLAGHVAAEVIAEVFPLPIDALDQRLRAAGVDPLASQLAVTPGEVLDHATSGLTPASIGPLRVAGTGPDLGGAVDVVDVAAQRPDQAAITGEVLLDVLAEFPGREFRDIDMEQFEYVVGSVMTYEGS